MYISGQERRLVNPPSQVVAGVRTVTTNMNGREHSHVRAHSLFSIRNIILTVNPAFLTGPRVTIFNQDFASYDEIVVHYPQ